MLKAFSGGFGMLALAGLLGEDQARAAGSVANPLAVRPAMFPPRAKRVISCLCTAGRRRWKPSTPSPC